MNDSSSTYCRSPSLAFPEAPFSSQPSPGKADSLLALTWFAYSQHSVAFFSSSEDHTTQEAVSSMRAGIESVSFTSVTPGPST